MGKKDLDFWLDSLLQSFYREEEGKKNTASVIVFLFVWGGNFSDSYLGTGGTQFHFTALNKAAGSLIASATSGYVPTRACNIGL